MLASCGRQLPLIFKQKNSLFSRCVGERTLKTVIVFVREISYHISIPDARPDGGKSID
jgi:hypothetical protein